MNKILKDRVRLIRAMQKHIVILNNNIPALDLMNKIISDIRGNAHGHFLSISIHDETKVSYARTTADKFNSEKRIKTTLSRYIRRQLEIDTTILTDQLLNIFSRKINFELLAADGVNKNIKILTGNDIVNHYKNTSTYSCMTNGNSYKTRLYAMNPDKVSLVVYNEIVRALLWKCDDGVMVLDRIYPSGCDNVELLQRWACKRDYVVRDDPDGASYENEEDLSDNKVHCVSLKYDDTFPYMDTFKFVVLDPTGKIAYCYNKLPKKPYVLATETSGQIPGEPYHCCSCSCSMGEDDAYCVNDNWYCRDCYSENFSSCDNCGGEYPAEDVININDSCYCERCANRLYKKCEDCDEYFAKNKIYDVCGGNKEVCGSCLENNYSQCRHCDEYVKSDDITEVNLHNVGSYSYKHGYVCESCLEDEFCKCNECEEYFHKDQLETINEKFYCETCKPEIEDEDEPAENINPSKDPLDKSISP